MRKIAGVKWIYKTKVNEKREIDRFKACLIAKGYIQKYIIDYSEVFAPVARHDMIRMIVSYISLSKCTIFKLDVKYTFLHGELVVLCDEHVYQCFFEDREKKNHQHHQAKNKIWKKKSINGAK